MINVDSVCAAISNDFNFICFAQEKQTTEIARFIISDARVNKVDVTETYLANRAYIVLYRMKGDNTVYMATVMATKDSQSYGNIYAVKTTHEAETAEHYKNETIRFNWSYANSYDSKEGTARITLGLVYKPVGTAFTLTMVTEDLDMNVYKGYVRGSLNLLQ